MAGRATDLSLAKKKRMNLGCVEKSENAILLRLEKWK
jgi:hypothetical protein